MNTEILITIMSTATITLLTLFITAQQKNIDLMPNTVVGAFISVVDFANLICAIAMEVMMLVGNLTLLALMYFKNASVKQYVIFAVWFIVSTIAVRLYVIQARKDNDEQ